MRRGEIWTAACGSHYAGKPRPVLIVQDDLFDATDSVTVCPLTSDPTEIPLLRIPMDADPDTGLNHRSSLMVDKITTMPRARLATRLGRAPDVHVIALSRALVVFLGLA